MHIAWWRESRRRMFMLTVLEPYHECSGARYEFGERIGRIVMAFPGPIQLSIAGLGDEYIVEGGHVPGEWKDDAYSISRRGMLTITAKPGAQPMKLAELAIWGEGKTGRWRHRPAEGAVPGHDHGSRGRHRHSDAEGSENQSPFIAPWLGLDLPVVVGKEESGKIEPEAPRVLRLVQGTGYSMKWNFKGRNPEARPPENVGVDVVSPAAAEIAVRRAKTEKKEEKYAEKGEFSCAHDHAHVA